MRYQARPTTIPLVGIRWVIFHAVANSQVSKVRDDTMVLLAYTNVPWEELNSSATLLDRMIDASCSQELCSSSRLWSNASSRTRKIIDTSGSRLNAMARKRCLDSADSKCVDRCRPLYVARCDISHAQLTSSHPILRTGWPSAASRNAVAASPVNTGHTVIDCTSHSLALPLADSCRSTLSCELRHCTCDTDEILETITEWKN